MRLKSLLIISSPDVIVSYNRVSMAKAKYGLRRAIGKMKTDLPYAGELQFFGDISRILGTEHTYLLGMPYKHFFQEKVPTDCPYPSNIGMNKFTVTYLSELPYILKKVDAILVSSGSLEIGKSAIELARKLSKPVIIHDFIDHEELYATADVKREIFRGFDKTGGFDMYFKKDLPLGYRSERVLPLAPAPIRPESYSFPLDSEKSFDIFYSGRPRPTRCQPDRAETVDLVQKHFSNINIQIQESRKTFQPIQNYWNSVASAKLALSPAGRVWDSYRHCEVGLCEGTALVAPKPYIETTGPKMKDGFNTILYDTDKRSGFYHLKDNDELVEKLKYYIKHDNERLEIAKNWQQDVLSQHTVYARSKYIVESIESIL